MSQRLDGDTYLGGALYGAGAGLTPANHLPLIGQAADGATAIGVKIGNVSALTNAGARIAAWYADNVTTQVAHITKDGYLGIATQAAAIASQAITLGGGAARQIYQERHATADTAGNALTVAAGGATAGATNKNGGALSLYSGVSTGTGYSDFAAYCYPSGGAGVADNTAVCAIQTNNALNNFWLYGGGNGTLSGTNNLGAGRGALAALTSGSENIAIGYSAGNKLTSGSTSVAVGNWALAGATTVSNNTAVGDHALYGANAAGNTAVGANAGYAVTAGTYNTFLGAAAGRYPTTGSYNTFLGYTSGRGAGAIYAGADYNTAVGNASAYNLGANADANVFLGSNAGYNHTTGSNQLYIANTANTTLIYGDFNGNKLGLCWDTSAAAPTLPTYDLSLWSKFDRTIGVMREAVADTAGPALYVRAGGATAGAMNKAGGTLHLLPGVSTGSAEAYALLYGYPAGGAGVADNTAVDILRVAGNGIYVGPTTAAPTAYLHLKAGTATAGTAPFKMTTGPVTATAEAGAWEFTSPTFFMTHVQRLAVVGLQFSQASDQTVANTNAETALHRDASAFGTRTIAAGGLNLVGKTVRVHAAGVYGSAAGGGPYTLQLRVRFGGVAGTVVLDTGAQTVSNGLSNRGWSIDGDVVVQTVADAGAVWAQGHALVSSTAAAGEPWDMESASAIALDTSNTAQEVYLSAQWNTADVANTITCRNFTIEILN
jgi:hypothetical protein